MPRLPPLCHTEASTPRLPPPTTEVSGTERPSVARSASRASPTSPSRSRCLRGVCPTHSRSSDGDVRDFHESPLPEAAHPSSSELLGKFSPRLPIDHVPYLSLEVTRLRGSIHFVAGRFWLETRTSETGPETGRKRPSRTQVSGFRCGGDQIGPNPHRFGVPKCDRSGMLQPCAARQCEAERSSESEAEWYGWSEIRFKTHPS